MVMRPIATLLFGLRVSLLCNDMGRHTKECRNG
jgi:hypothetical protein